jgi:hypothetical protein
MESNEHTSRHEGDGLPVMSRAFFPLTAVCARQTAAGRSRLRRPALGASVDLRYSAAQLRNLRKRAVVRTPFTKRCLTVAAQQGCTVGKRPTSTTFLRLLPL